MEAWTDWDEAVNFATETGRATPLHPNLLLDIDERLDMAMADAEDGWWLKHIWIVVVWVAGLLTGWSIQSLF